MSLFWRIDFRLFGAVCGEIATQRGAILVEFRLGGFERLQLHVTVRAPYAAVEAEHERAASSKDPPS